MVDTFEVHEPELAPEVPPHGPIVWMRENLFNSVLNSILTFVGLASAAGFLFGILDFTFSEERRWDAVATNLRLYMVQAYPESDFGRIWTSLAVVVILSGLSIAIYRAGSTTTLHRVLGAVAQTFSFLAVAALLLPALSWKWTAFIVLAVLAAATWYGRSAFGDRAKEISLSTLSVGVVVLGLVILALWVVPIGRFEFVDGQVLPRQPGTIALSTKLPLTIQAIVLVISYYVGVAIRDRIAERTLRSVTLMLWLLSMPTIVLLIMRKPELVPSRIIEHAIIFAVFGAAGFVLFEFMTRPERPSWGGILQAASLVLAVVVWFLPVTFLVRLMALTFAIFALGGPSFAGDVPARRRYQYTWVGLTFFFALFLYAAGAETDLVLTSTNFLGGLALTFVLALGGILLSFPIGTVMALGRTSTMPIFRILSTVYIEFVRGIPFITVLYFFDTLVPLFLASGVEVNDIVQALLGTTLFSAAYLAENVRGGLQSVRKGQYEASQALGLSTVQLTSLIVMPQALRAVLPALVSQAIAIFKDTSLVAIIGLFDFLYIGFKVVPQQTAFLGIRRENLLFIAVVYWLFTFAFSRSSIRLEKRLGLGER